MYDRARLMTAAVVIALVSVLIFLPLSGKKVVEGLAGFYLLRQDLPFVPVFLAALLIRPTLRSSTLLNVSKHAQLALCLSLFAIFAAGCIGHYLIFEGYDFSRDEKMAVFDQDIFAHGRLLWPIPLEWRPVADALNRLFILPIGEREFWVSAYLPIHSAYRAALSMIGAATLASPLMAALATYCTWRIARRLWPESYRPALLSLVLFATSSQVILTSMTAFSMTMHMALNMLWLALFLADRRSTHAAAVLIGFLATGIHQPLFHPLFALPFLVLLLFQRRWKLSAFYLAAYAAIGAFWMLWPLWIASHGVANAVVDCATENCESIGFVDRLLAAIEPPDLRSVWLTAANLLRFFLWQNPLLGPLALAGAIACWRAQPLVRALAASLVLPVIVLAIILPWQGHGWGYRYVHPALGSAILLACFGYRYFEKKGLSVDRPLMISSVIALALLSVHAWMANRMVGVLAQISAELSTIRADAVIVDTEKVPFGQDLVYNRFDLSNRPKLLIALYLKPQDLTHLCRHSVISFYDAPRMAAITKVYGFPVPTEPSPRQMKLREGARQLNCRVVE